MMDGDDAGALLSEVRRHHLRQVNGVLRRPGMYGPDETAERLLLEAMAAVDGALPRWQAQCDRLREHGAFLSTGVRGAYSYILPSGALRDATASMYAEIAHRLGWLELDCAMAPEAFHDLRAGIGEWVDRDRTLPDVVQAFGPPSLWIGGSNRSWPKTLAYTTANHDDPLVCFHLWNSVPDAAPGTGSQAAVHPEPVLLAVRHRPGNFPDSFSFTPEGKRRRVAAAQ